MQTQIARNYSVGSSRRSPQDQIGLGNLLREAGRINSSTLETSLKRAQKSRALLGKTLLKMQAVSLDVLNTALAAISMVKRGEITKAVAVSGLTPYCAERSEFDALLRNMSHCRP